MSPPAALSDKFISSLGSFYAVWSITEGVIDFALGKFLNLPPHDTHLLTASMEFSRKLSVLRGLISKSNHQNKDALIKTINTIQNESKRNVFSHSVIRTTADQIIFVERTTHGRYSAKLHKFTPDEFSTHVKHFVKAGMDFHDALDVSEAEVEAFLDAAVSIK